MFSVRHLYVILLLGAFLLPATSCSRGGRGGEDADSVLSADLFTDSVNINASDLTEDAQRWADSLLLSMTLEQRLGQLLMPAVYADASPEAIRRLRRYVADCHVGGVVLLKGSKEGAEKVGAELRRGANVEPFVAIDAEWGLGMRLDKMPIFPRNGLISHSVSEATLYEYGQEVAVECRNLGINVVLGPVADVSDGSGVIGSRSFGSDPKRVALMTTAYARGLEDGNVISVAKHFPGHGSPSADTHLQLAVIPHSRAELDSIDLPPFQAYIRGGMSGIMAGHLAVPAIDDSATPASFSYQLLTELLRNELDFRGLIFTDAINMGGAENYDAVDAVLAGADIVLAPTDTRQELSKLMAAVGTGRLPLQMVNDRCRRILFYKYLSLTPPDSRQSTTDVIDHLRRSLSTATD